MSIDERNKAAKHKKAAGNMMAGLDVTYAYYMGDGPGGNYEGKAEVDREVLGLVEEDPDTAISNSLE